MNLGFGKHCKRRILLFASLRVPKEKFVKNLSRMSAEGIRVKGRTFAAVLDERLGGRNYEENVLLKQSVTI